MFHFTSHENPLVCTVVYEVRQRVAIHLLMNHVSFGSDMSSLYCLLRLTEKEEDDKLM